ncbi:MAG TPA: hypothetical protein VNB24_06100 [Acidimicrobiales bacterium]|nr:hypothetical protein [Acidimicrobiales bacterium]
MALARVFAYLDPGTGSQIMMAFMAGFAGLLVVVKMYWSRILGVFSPKARARAKQLAEERAADRATKADTHDSH